MAHSLARFVSQASWKAGWGFEHADRAYDSCLERSLQEAAALNSILGPPMTRVWTRALRQARLITFTRTAGWSLVAATVVVVTRDLPLWTLFAAFIYPSVRCIRQPRFHALERTHSSMLGAARTLGLAERVVGDSDAVRAIAFSDGQLHDILTPLLDSLDDATREIVLALQPNFPGTFGEMKLCAAELLRP